MGGVVKAIGSIFGGGSSPQVVVEQPKPVMDLVADSAKQKTETDTTSQTLAPSQVSKKKTGIKNSVQIATAQKVDRGNN